jgi:O-antigen/teichoic acid export membrane protein
MRERLKHLTTGVAIYGAGDAAIQIVNFALLAVYVKGGFLTSRDYGALAIIGAVEAFAKVVSRWGLDGAFMRYYHERGQELPRFASTIVWFLTASNVAVFGTALALAGPVGRRFFDDPSYVGALRLMLVNAFLMALTFVPFHAMRMERRAMTYSAFTFARSVGTLVLRIVLVIGLGYGLAGVYLADIAVTLVLVPMMWPWFKPHVRLAFSRDDLLTALRFGLPRVPHGLAQQVLDGGNKLLLGTHITQAQLGIYQNAVTLGTGVKFFTSAFETAWAPFYYATAREPGAAVTFAKITTYGVAVLALLVAGLSATSEDLVRLMLTPDYLPAVPILPLVALGLACHGLYLLTSIGLNLTSRTEFYPLSTFAAAVVGLGMGALLMPSLGAFGAAIAFLLSYATLALIAYLFARRFYPIPLEGSRLVRIVLSATAAAVAARWLVPAWHPALSLLAHGFVTMAVYGALLASSGFLRASERSFLREALERARRKRGPAIEGDTL